MATEKNITIKQFNGTDYDTLYPKTIASQVDGVYNKTEVDALLANKLGGIESTDYPGCYYRMVSGVTEWFNPPVQLGVEYRTTERYLGKPVYVKVVDCGNLPASGLKNIAHRIANCKPIQVYGEMSNGNTLPYTTATNYYISADVNYIQIYVTGDFSGLTAKATIKYTKTTD